MMYDRRYYDSRNGSFSNGTSGGMNGNWNGAPNGTNGPDVPDLVVGIDFGQTCTGKSLIATILAIADAGFNHRRRICPPKPGQR